ncbi:MAG: 50S ribosomal protein L11 methyltransferase [Blastocatellia bacterium]
MSDYSVGDYQSMVADTVRMDAYLQALRQQITPGAVVLDIGTGTGIFAFWAIRFGARKVYAIEPNNAVQTGREIAAASGLSEQIEFIQGLSTQITLPEKADVIVSDLRGTLPLYAHHIPTIIDARQRLLTAGGVLIPQHDVLQVAMVSSADLYVPYVNAFNQYPDGVDVTAARKINLNSWGSGRPSPNQLIGQPQQWCRLDYRTIDSASISGEMNWQVEREALAHGFCVWFDTTLTDGIGFSNAPGGGAKVYGSAFFPWLEPVNLAAGDRVSLELKANLVGDDYIWIWNTLIQEAGNGQLPKADFRQSTFFGFSLSPQTLHKQSAAYVPRLKEDGRIAQFVLHLISEGLAQGEIANRLAAAYPAHFKRQRDALSHVALLAEKFCE